jgi:Tol biopolymer transport system component
MLAKALFLLVALLFACSCAESKERPTEAPLARNGVIVASRGRNGLELVRINPRTGRLTRLSKAPDPSETDPTWAPDGSKFAFIRETIEGAELRLMNAKGQDLGLVGRLDDSFAHPAWSPIRGEIAYNDGPGSMAVLDLDSHSVRRIPAAGDDPTWSPDGKRIAYARDKTGNGDTSIWEAAVDGGGRHQLTHPQGGAADRAPAWSPDGNTIAFQRDYDVWLLDLASGNEKPLARFADSPSWSPDSGTILVSKIQRVRPYGGLFAIAIADGHERLIAPGIIWAGSSWQPLSD